MGTPARLEARTVGAFPRYLGAQSASAQGTSLWTDDFQLLNLSERPNSHIFDRAGPQGPKVPNVAEGWHRDFRLQQEDADRRESQSNLEARFDGLYNNKSSIFPAQEALSYGAIDPLTYEPTFSHVDDVHEQVPELPEDIIFERAFEAARLELRKQEIENRPQHDYARWSSEFANGQDTEHPTYPGSGQSTLRIGADLVPDAREVQSHDEGVEKDDLARTAEKLLDSIKDDHSQRFRDSSFLQLMRRIRDRQVVVEGNHIVEVRWPLCESRG